MKVYYRILIMLLLCTLTLFTGCKSSCKKDKTDPYDGKFGKKIEEDLISTNIIEDN